MLDDGLDGYGEEWGLTHEAADWLVLEDGEDEGGEAPPEQGRLSCRSRIIHQDKVVQSEHDKVVSSLRERNGWRWWYREEACPLDLVDDGYTVYCSGSFRAYCWRLAGGQRPLKLVNRTLYRVLMEKVLCYLQYSLPISPPITLSISIYTLKIVQSTIQNSVLHVRIHVF
jgi:hypothetical protein